MSDPAPPPAEPYKPGSRWDNLWRIVGGVAAFGAARFVGVSVIIPVIGWGLSLWAFNALFPPDRKPLANPLAWQAGHFIWFAAGLIVLPGQWLAVVPEIVVLSGLMVALYLTQVRWIAIALAVLQTAGLAINIWMLTQQDPLSLPGRALMVHILWRAVAVVLFAMVFRRLSQLRQDQSTVFE